MTRTIPSEIKWKILAKQKYRCNNAPDTHCRNLDGYECPLWKKRSDSGIFDHKGYQFDHIIEYSLTKDSSEQNLQALCVYCHAEKTRQFMQSKTNQKIEEYKNKKIQFTLIDGCYTCDICYRRFANKQNFYNHKVKKRKCSRPEYTCKYCDDQFTTKTSMYRHIRTTCKNAKKINQPKNIITKLRKIEEQNKHLLRKIELIEDDYRDIKLKGLHQKNNKSPNIGISKANPGYDYDTENEVDMAYLESDDTQTENKIIKVVKASKKRKIKTAGRPGTKRKVARDKKRS